ncbi:hypothetical protein AB0B50_16270 [Streptomyces sp. NPDC041068]|uniref:hypothetical protein n=1 Tax=Streptomyces sp. NPDC041068 TaxID=3155130 RepID=UPI0033F72900
MSEEISFEELLNLARADAMRAEAVCSDCGTPCVGCPEGCAEHLDHLVIREASRS